MRVPGAKPVCAQPLYVQQQQAVSALRTHSRAGVTDTGFGPGGVKRNTVHSSCSSIENGVNAISTGEPGPGVAGLGDSYTRPLKFVFSFRFLSVLLSASIAPTGISRSFRTLVRDVGPRHGAPARRRSGSERFEHRARRAPRISIAGPYRTHAGSSEPIA